jgi:hypothetical protein
MQERPAIKGKAAAVNGAMVGVLPIERRLPQCSATCLAHLLRMITEDGLPKDGADQVCAQLFLIIVQSDHHRVTISNSLLPLKSCPSLLHKVVCH